VYRTLDRVQRWQRIGRHGVWTPDLARKQARSVLMARDLGKDPSADKMALRSAPTVAQLLDDYLADMQSGKMNGKKASTIKGDVSRIATHIKPALGTLKVMSVTQSNIEVFMNSLTPGSAACIIGLTSGIFSYAIKKGFRTDNPCRGIKMPKDRKRVRRLSGAEYPELWKTLQNNEHVTADVFLMLTITGLGLVRCAA
jgi:hypothetical protein